MLSRNAKALTLVIALVVGLFSLVACSTPAPAPTPTKPAAAPAPTAAPAAPTAATKAAEPTKAAAPTSAPAAQASDYPQKGKPINLICPLSAGSGSDIAARMMAMGLEKELGVPVQVVNKVGGGTVIGMTEVAKARPDGYTLGTAVFMSLLVSYLDPEMKASYGRKDFQPVAHFSRERNVLIVKGDSKYKTIDDLVKDAKANPGNVKFGGSGILGNPHIAMLMLEKAAGVQFAAVQFPGAGDAVTALLGGHVDFVATGGSTVVGHVKDNAVRILGITDSQENEFYPGVKTLTAQGYDVVSPFTIGLVAPAGVPKEVVTTLSKGLEKAYANTDFAAKVKAASISADYMDTEKFTAFWDGLDPKLKPYIDLIRQERK